jgi:hypothetical protein
MLSNTVPSAEALGFLMSPLKGLGRLIGWLTQHSATLRAGLDYGLRFAESQYLAAHAPMVNIVTPWDLSAFDLQRFSVSLSFSAWCAQLELPSLAKHLQPLKLPAITAS